jgi:hypothetical protein
MAARFTRIAGLCQAFGRSTRDPAGRRRCGVCRDDAELPYVNECGGCGQVAQMIFKTVLDRLAKIEWQQVAALSAGL